MLFRSRTRVLRIDPQGVVRVDGKVVEVATVVGPASEVVLVPDPGAAYGVVAPVIQAVLAAGAGEVRLEETPAR